MDLHKEQHVTISLRIPVALREKLKEKADENDRPISAEIRMLIISGMNSLYKGEIKEHWLI